MSSFSIVRLMLNAIVGMAMLVGHAPASDAATRKSSARKSSCVDAFEVAAVASAAVPPAKVTSDDSLKAGILMHGEHWVDLVLRQAGVSDSRPMKVFEETLNQLVNGIKAGQLAGVNEKIDGSPSVVFGFDAQGKPFVAYKGHFVRKAQALIRTVEEAELHLKDKPALLQIFTKLISLAGQPMTKMAKSKMGSRFSNFIVQGDLLFVEGDDRRVIARDGITIQPNALAYKIAKDHPLHAKIKRAAAGIAFHTIGERVVEESGRLSVKALTNTEEEGRLVREFVQAIQSPKIFAIDPWHEKIEITKGAFSQIDIGLKEIKASLSTLSPEFREIWAKSFEAKWRTYLNTGLSAGQDGGFYKMAATGQKIEPSEWIRGFLEWLQSREEHKLATKFSLAMETHGKEMASVLEAYASAIAIQYQIQPFLSGAFVSKLGGGSVEGMMLQTEDSVVKWVDRLDFTMKNNERWKRETPGAGAGVAAGVGAGPGPGLAIVAAAQVGVPPAQPQAQPRYLPMASKTAASLPYPVDEWRPGASYIVMKVQPFHRAHIEMMREAAARFPGAPLFILASDKEPNLAATHWKDLGAAETKGQLIAREYIHVFDRRFRLNLGRAGLRGIDAELVLMSPADFWRHLARAKANGRTGKIRLFVGAKEIADGSYDAQAVDYGDLLEIHAIDMKIDGLSGTEVRNALRAAVLGNAEEQAAAMKTLDLTFSYLPDDGTRTRAIEGALKRWRLVDEAAQRLVSKPMARAN